MNRPEVVYAIIDAAIEGTEDVILEHRATQSEVVAALVAVGHQAFQTAVKAGADPETLQKVITCFTETLHGKAH